MSWNSNVRWRTQRPSDVWCGYCQSAIEPPESVAEIRNEDGELSDYGGTVFHLACATSAEEEMAR